MNDRTVTISGAAGAWGDSSLSTSQLLDDGRSDYVVYEGLAEITMAILSRARQKSPDQGYARDLIEVIARNLRGFRDIGAKVITNAGGVNPEAAARLIHESDPRTRVATVTGDEIAVSSLDRLGLPGDPISVNAYLGARPIAAALEAGADVVVTGRVVDSALVLGPLIHEFGWPQDSFDLLSAGSLAGHLLECGPQSTGGLLTDWRDTKSWANPGFPIAQVSVDGSFILTAPETSDALVDTRTVTEQLLYEISDPARYLLPDVVCDWTRVRVEEIGPNRVSVHGAVGLAPPPTLKACAQVPDGWRAQFLLLVGGRDAPDKARRVARDLLDRGSVLLRRAGMGAFEATHVEVLGAEDTYGDNARRSDTREVVLKLAVHHASREAVAAFVREVPSIGLAGPPGVSGGGSGLPRPSPLIRLECFPVSREEVTAVVKLDGRVVDFADVDESLCAMPPEPSRPDLPGGVAGGPTIELPLIAVAHGRSGDKGADLNIGIRSRHRDFWPLVVAEVDEDRVGAHLRHLGAAEVRRYLLPGIGALNLVLQGGLGAGGTASLRFDPQGKAAAQQLLDMPISLPVSMIDHRGLAEIPEVLEARRAVVGI